MSGNLLQTSPRRSAPVRTGGATPSAAEAAPVFGDLDPLLDRFAELLAACDRADARGDNVTTALIRQLLGGKATVDRVLAGMGAR